MAALNEAIGLPLPEAHELRTPLTAAALDNRSLAAYEKDGVETRPDLRQSRLQTTLAETRSESARAAMLPQVILHAGFEADRQQFVNRGGTNWLAAATLRWNLFNGGADKARIEQAASGVGRARALGTQAEAQVRLQVRRAWADLRSATERIEVAEGAVAIAEESLRITKNRFDAGLATVTDLLRTETALLEVRDRRLAAVYDQRLAAVNLELASGRLSPTSEVLN
jgi:outer membrane protein TolC